MNKKIPFLTLMVLLSAGALAGCGGGDDPNEIIFWHTLGQEKQQLLNTMVAEFEELHPGYKVRASNQGGDYDALFDKIKMSLASGTNPDMAFCYPDHVATYLEQGKVVNMESYVDDPEIGFAASDGSHVEEGVTISGEDDFIEIYWREGQSYSTPGLYSVPYAKSAEVLFYNKTVFDQNGWPIPTKWFNDDDPNDLTAMFNLTRVIHEQYMGDSSFEAPLGYDSDENMFITLHRQMGIPYTAQGNTFAERYPFIDSAESRALIQKLKTIYDTGAVEEGSINKHQFITKGTNGGGYTSSMFTEEKVLMTIGSTGGTSYNQGPFEIGVTKIPQQNPDNPDNLGTVTQGPSICFFNTADNNELSIAWQFYRFITNALNSARYATLTGYEPVRISSYDTDEYQAHLAPAEPGEVDTIFRKVARTTATMQNDYFNTAVFVGSDKARTVAGSILTNVLTGVQSVSAAYENARTELSF